MYICVFLCLHVCGTVEWNCHLPTDTYKPHTNLTATYIHNPLTLIQWTNVSTDIVWLASPFQKTPKLVCLDSHEGRDSVAAIVIRKHSLDQSDTFTLTQCNTIHDLQSAESVYDLKCFSTHTQLDSGHHQQIPPVSTNLSCQYSDETDDWGFVHYSCLLNHNITDQQCMTEKYWIYMLERPRL